MTSPCSSVNDDRLTWGDVGADGSFARFRRAKLMIGDIEPEEPVHTPSDLVISGGDDGTRTHDPLLAKQVL